MNIIGILNENRTDSSCIILYDNQKSIYKYQFIFENGIWSRSTLIEQIPQNLLKTTDNPLTPIAIWYKKEGSNYQVLSSVSVNKNWDLGNYYASYETPASNPRVWIKKVEAKDTNQPGQPPVVDGFEFYIDWKRWDFWWIDDGMTQFFLYTENEDHQVYTIDNDSVIKAQAKWWVNGKTQKFANKVTLESPSDEKIFNSKSVTLKWYQPSPYNILNYHLRVSKYHDFSSLLLEKTDLVTINYTIPEDKLNDGTYYWQVRAKNQYDPWGEWSDIREFKIQMIPTAVNLLIPDPNKTFKYVGTVNFKWTTSVGAQPLTYRLSLTYDQAGYQNYTSIHNITNTEYLLQNIPHGTYWWSVLASNSAGSTWAFPRRKITIDFTPLAPHTLWLQASDSNHPELTWTQAENAEEYYIYRSLSGGEFELIQIVGWGCTNWIDEPLWCSGDSFIYYYVKTKNNFGLSPASYTISINGH